MRRAVGALLRKEASLELRTPQVIPAMALFSLVTYVVFHFGLRRNELAGDLASGVLWVTILFAAMLGAARLFVTDRDEGGFDAFLLAPVDRTSLFVAKAISMLVFLATVQVVAIPAFVILLLGPGLSSAETLDLIVVLVLADLGIAIVGTLVGALAVQTRARDLIVPLLALPLLVPVIIGAARATSPLLLEHATALPGRWLGVLALYDLVFGLIAYGVFDFLVED
jgi:heme exporter protein B